jgi:hypothetical protein
MGVENPLGKLSCGLGFVNINTNETKITGTPIKRQSLNETIGLLVLLNFNMKLV